MTRGNLWQRFRRSESGAVLAEFAYTSVFLVILCLIVFDFAWFFARQAMGEYAAHIAVRIAVVRPPVCAGVPNSIDRGTGTDRFGTLCIDAVANACVMPTVQCNGAADATSTEIMQTIGPFLPAGATSANLQFSYTAPPANSIGFLGGPYVPIVSVSLVNLQHQFLLPIPTLLSPWSGGAGGAFAPIAMGPMTATMPGEDLSCGPDDDGSAC